jgi:pentatricopeptide repeat protein
MKDISNEIFGRLTVLKPTKERGDRNIIWECSCNCGKITFVTYKNLIKGRTKSCGNCGLKSEITSKANKLRIIHGHSRTGKFTKVYTMWNSMLTRCYNQHTKDYKNYGGRGINVHLPWHKFEYFLEDLKKLNLYDLAMTKGYSIDRIENNGDYWPENIKMSTSKEQNNNRRERIVCKDLL